MSTASDFQPDVIVVGAGLAGLVATHELAKAGKRVLVLDQENRHNLGGQAFWSLGGLFFVDSPEQHRMGIHDSLDLALQDWHGSAQFDRFGDGTDGPGRGEDFWPQQWAEAYVRWAHEGKRDYVRDLGLKSLTFVGWAERGDGRAEGHGNSVPRFHITWGTGPEVVRVFLEPVLEAEKAGLVQFGFRHQVDEVVVEDGAVVGLRGSVLAADDSARGVKSSREVTGSFDLRARAVVVSSGGIGHNFDLMRRNWPTDRVGPAPEHMIAGVPAHVDGRMLAISEEAGATLVNKDRMWAYVEGVHNWDPIWPDHAIRILPGPSSMWFDANGKRLQGMSGVPGADSIGSMTQILSTGYDYSWFILDQTIIEKEFALSGSEQNPDWTNKDVRLMLRDRVLGKGATGPVERFKKYGEDFVVASTIAELVEGMNAITRGPELSADDIERQIVARDRQVDNPFAKDAQIMAIHNGRKDRTGKIMRVAKPHKILDPEHGPLIAVRCNILSRKTLGGIETNLDSQAIAEDGSVIPGLYAAGEVAGFGGGGVHGYNALEGTFLGGCIFSGRAAGLALARDL
ncbi:FAD-binding dehydrogenase [Nocardioides jejuensis]|uniref:FAD-binding dehydrogenase n=1 Tax=Nocardioides jejuensis TaxID=2502782 RepID=A0A4R1CC59_9ACTN|nr:FAD-binding dehydrogenase [Nocardioides jejuensis]TCJ28311.1 FAD-binding dehydrogenase [Nocardioides jejuensis]